MNRDGGAEGSARRQLPESLCLPSRWRRCASDNKACTCSKYTSASAPESRGILLVLLLLLLPLVSPTSQVDVCCVGAHAWQVPFSTSFNEPWSMRSCRVKCKCMPTGAFLDAR
uniref:Uncharacterized protein n=1 Tax=Alexandrium catenella TaxID=2925 RepID=A0A7S1WVF2_ALECA